ncbi:MAG: hypothetical protein H6831_11115 [Planctomycetes bacterium]|nr:hypothetical protein [Planctomycetota bacterium]
MSGSVFARRGVRLGVVCVPWFFALACSPADDEVVVLKPLYCKADCEHCELSASELVDLLPLPPPRARETAPERSAMKNHRHRAVVEVRSHGGVPAANARVDVWRHRRGAEPVLDGTALTDVDGIATIPFDGRGVFCVHAEHPDVGTAARPVRQLRLSDEPQAWIVELVLPAGEVVLQRAGVVQVGVAAPDGSPLPLACVAVWRHEFGAEEPILAGTGSTDEHGVVRIELDRPALYAVAASHADYPADSVDYAWFVPRSPRGELRTDELRGDRRFVDCDAHVRLGADPEDGLRVPFHEHHLGSEDDLVATEVPACCRTWSCSTKETARREGMHAAGTNTQLAHARVTSTRRADPPAITRMNDEATPFTSGSNSSFERISPVEASTHATVRHR